MKRTQRKTGAVNSKKRKADGITFASSLEHYCYMKLKEAELEFGYEAEKFEILPGFVYEGMYMKSSPKMKDLVNKGNKKVLAITYTPDFISHTHKFIIETKGYVPSQHTFPLRWKLFMHYMQSVGKGDYKLFLPKNRAQVDLTIKTIRHAITNDKTRA